MRASQNEMAREEMRAPDGSERPPIAPDLATSRDDAAARTRRPDLDEQLNALQKDASEHYQIYRRSHEQLWRLLARLYLWWRSASQEVGYLESLYEQKDIRYRKADRK
jgi:hypothetical protein